MSTDIVKPLVTSLVAGLANRYICKETSMKRNAIFAGAVGVGVFAGGAVATMIPPMGSVLGNGKGLSARVVEVGLGSAVSYGINKVLMQNVSYGDSFAKKVGIIVVADIIGEYASDYMAGRPLSLLE